MRAIVTWLGGLVILGGLVLLLALLLPKGERVVVTEKVAEPEREPKPAIVAQEYRVVREYPHDPKTYTQGLIYRDGFLYESSGLTGRSFLAKVRLETGEVVERRSLRGYFFGEGLTDWGEKLIQLAPMRSGKPGPFSIFSDSSVTADAVRLAFGINVALVYDLSSLKPQPEMTFEGEGWGLTHDEERLIMSDGSSQLQFRDPVTFKELGRLPVTHNGLAMEGLNELEFVKGQIYANVRLSDSIAIVNPSTGEITGLVDLSELRPRQVPPPFDGSFPAILNGIAYDKNGDRLFVTGKFWPRLFEIKIQ